MTMHRQIVALLVACTFIAAGCGGGDSRFDTAPVRGKVLCEGEPLTSGMISFTPIAEGETATPGKLATGVVGPDGTFVLTTYEPEDGAIIGRHTVYYSPPGEREGGDAEEEDEEDGEASGTIPAASTTPLPDTHPCRFGGLAEAEVIDGDNDLTIDLARWNPADGENGSELEEGAE
jgi:hypothetical protein